MYMYRKAQMIAAVSVGQDMCSKGVMTLLCAVLLLHVQKTSIGIEIATVAASCWPSSIRDEPVQLLSVSKKVRELYCTVLQQCYVHVNKYEKHFSKM